MPPGGLLAQQSSLALPRTLLPRILPHAPSQGPSQHQSPLVLCLPTDCCNCPAARDRHGGRDHIWLMSHDEGACYAPSEIYDVSIFLTHWGRMDLHHK